MVEEGRIEALREALGGPIAAPVHLDQAEYLNDSAILKLPLFAMFSLSLSERPMLCCWGSIPFPGSHITLLPRLHRPTNQPGTTARVHVTDLR